MYKIKILGWGSLITRPRTLEAAKFFQDGPFFPIQYSRISKSGSVTLVKDFTNGSIVQTWSAYSNFTSLKQAIDNLKEREMTVEDYIGFLDIKNKKYRINYIENSNIHIYKGKFTDNLSFDQLLPECLLLLLFTIIKWTHNQKIDAVIWTDLPPNFIDKTDTKWSTKNLYTYLSNLSPNIKNRSKDYILNIPENVFKGLDSSYLLHFLK